MTFVLTKLKKFKCKGQALGTRLLQSLMNCCFFLLQKLHEHGQAENSSFTPALSAVCIKGAFQPRLHQQGGCC